VWITGNAIDELIKARHSAQQQAAHFSFYGKVCLMQKTPPKLEISFGRSFKASAIGGFAICALLMTLIVAAFGYLGGATSGWW